MKYPRNNTKGLGKGGNSGYILLMFVSNLRQNVNTRQAEHAASGVLLSLSLLLLP